MGNKFKADVCVWLSGTMAACAWCRADTWPWFMVCLPVLMSLFGLILAWAHRLQGPEKHLPQSDLVPSEFDGED